MAKEMAPEISMFMFNNDRISEQLRDVFSGKPVIREMHIIAELNEALIKLHRKNDDLRHELTRVRQESMLLRDSNRLLQNRINMLTGDI
jgi:hypothetical protein